MEHLQVSLGVTVLLALAVFLLLVAETMPPQSDSVPLIGIIVTNYCNHQVDYVLKYELT